MPDRPFQINSVSLPLIGSDYLDEQPGWMSVDAMITYIVGIGSTDVRLIPSLGSVTDPNMNSIDTSNTFMPSVDKVIAFCAKLTAAGLNIEIAPFLPVDISLIQAGKQFVRPTDPEAFFASYSEQMLMWADIAEQVGAVRFAAFQDDTWHLTVPEYPELVDDWLKYFADIRSVFTGQVTSLIGVDGSVFGAGGLLAKDGSFNGVDRLSHLHLTYPEIIAQLDVIGVALMPDPFTDKLNPTVEELKAAWFGNENGLNAVSFLEALHEYFGKPMYIADRAFHSFDGSNIDHAQIFGSNPLTVDQQEQADLYEAFLSVWSQEAGDWMLGVSFQNVNRIPDYRDGIARFVDSPVGENFQGKLAEAVISAWFNGERQTVAAPVDGTPDADRIATGYNHDTIHALAGNDVILSGAGSDVIWGGEGADAIDGGAGVDTVRYDDFALGVTVNLLTGRGSGNHAEGDTYVSIENVVGSSQADTLIGNGADNVLDGREGNDTLIGHTGADTLSGGPGIDTASYAGDEGGIFVNLTLGRGYGNASYGDTYDSIENVIGTDYNDFLIGDPGVNRLDGAGGNDTIIGAVGPDEIIGGAGLDWASYEDNSGTVFINLTLARGYNNAAEGDTYSGIENLIGGLMDDFFIGDENANRLNGAMGADTLLGAGGADIFMFTYAPGATSVWGHPNVDLILDFTTGVDTIELAASAFPGLAVGTLPASAFYAGTAAHDADDRIIYDSATGKLFFDPDGTGAQAAVQFATLGESTHPAALAATDFVVA